MTTESRGMTAALKIARHVVLLLPTIALLTHEVSAQTVTDTPTPTPMNTPTSTATSTATSCRGDAPVVAPVTSPTDQLQQVILFCGRIVGFSSMEVFSEAGSATDIRFGAGCPPCPNPGNASCNQGTVPLLPNQTNHITVCQDNNSGCGISRCVTVDVNNDPLTIVQVLTTPTETPTSAPTPTPTATLPAGCPAEPAAGCRTAMKSRVILDENADTTKDRLLWKWVRGQATSQEFGDPTATAAYSLCMYDGSALLLGAGIPPSATKWSALGSTGYAYRDSAGGADGIDQVLLKGSLQNNAKVRVKGKGSNVPHVTLGNLPLPVTVQLHNRSTGLCLEGAYTTDDVIKNIATQFKAKVP